MTFTNKLGTMHREFRKLLEAAKGISEFPIALNVDIRGFSKWSGDSAESGLFIKKVYIRLIDEFFQGASFYKATGDGLLVLFPVDESDPKAAVRTTVKLALDIVRKFPDLTKGDPMINFPTPAAVGVGLARGPASRLISGRKTLDYSGTTLNLASRLMDLARPQGVVMDGEFGFDLLTPSIKKRFELERVYLKGVAPNIGREVYFTSEWTEIPKSAKKPADGTTWGTGYWKSTRKDIEEAIGTFMVPIDARPENSEEIHCFVKHDAPTKDGERSKKRWVAMDLRSSSFKFEETADGPMVRLNMDEVHDILEALGGGPDFPVEIRIEFVAA